VARVTLTSRAPLRFRPQRFLGRDVHFWLRATGLDTAPFGPRLLAAGVRSVLDTGRYRAAIRAGRPDHRPLFRMLVPDGVVWHDGARERVDTLVLATGYRPNLDYLAGLGALGPDGHPPQRAGISTTVPGLGYLGLPFQRSFASATIRGVGADAEHVVQILRRQLQGRTGVCCRLPGPGARGAAALAIGASA
jgi:putative flavoprotein involved in K+ transport